MSYNDDGSYFINIWSRRTSPLVHKHTTHIFSSHPSTTSYLIEIIIPDIYMLELAGKMQPSLKNWQFEKVQSFKSFERRDDTGIGVQGMDGTYIVMIGLNSIDKGF